MADGTTIIPELFLAIGALFSIIIWLVKERIERDAVTITTLQAKVWELITITNAALPIFADTTKETGTVVRELKDMMKLQAMKDEAREDASTPSARALPEKSGGQAG